MPNCWALAIAKPAGAGPSVQRGVGAGGFDQAPQAGLLGKDASGAGAVRHGHGLQCRAGVGGGLIAIGGRKGDGTPRRYFLPLLG
jgi:hypothetical protein